MGPPKTPILSALGESVNTAARLERITKDLQMPVAVSGDTLAAAQFSHEVPLRDVSLDGRSEPLAMAPLNAQRLRELLISS
jgi:class 3 adenylate cyclase